MIHALWHRLRGHHIRVVWVRRYGVFWPSSDWYCETHREWAA